MLTTKKLSGGAPSGLYNEGFGEDNWEPGPGTGYSSGTVHEARSDNLYIYIENSSADRQKASWTTRERYDLTDVDIIEVEFVYDSTNGNDISIVIDPQNDYTYAYNAYKATFLSNPPKNTRSTHQMDVSAESGEYYISHYMDVDDAPDSNDGELRTYRVELDP
jgi:hypothetical protein